MKITTRGNYFKRWESILVNSTGASGMVTENVTRDFYTTITVHPYNPSKYRLVRFLQLQWIKIKTHYS